MNHHLFHNEPSFRVDPLVEWFPQPPLELPHATTGQIITTCALVAWGRVRLFVTNLELDVARAKLARLADARSEAFRDGTVDDVTHIDGRIVDKALQVAALRERRGALRQAARVRRHEDE